MIRLKPQARIQRVISTQRGQYRKELNDKDKKIIIWKAEQDEVHAATHLDMQYVQTSTTSVVTDNLPGEYVLRTCMIGEGCELNRHFKQFRVNLQATNAHDKSVPDVSPLRQPLIKWWQLRSTL